MKIWSTCSQCGNVVQGERKFIESGHEPTDTYEPHTCEDLGELTTAKHIQYHQAHANSASEGNHGDNNQEK